MISDRSPPRRFAFPRNRRLLKAAEFQNVLSSECRSGDRLFAVAARRNNAAQARLGVAVARRVSPRAHERNRIKRCIRETFRLNQADVAGLDVVVLARPESAAAAGSTLARALVRHFRHLGRRCADF